MDADRTPSAAREHRESVNDLYESAVESGITSAASARLDPHQLEMIAVALLDPKAYPKLREQMAADVRRSAARVEVSRG